MKLKLPSSTLTRGTVPKPNLRAIARRVRKVALTGVGLFFVFFVFAWINLPTKAMAWRISHEAKNAGFMISIDDLSVSPFGSVTLYDVVWSFKPAHPDQTPVPFVIQEVEVDLSLLSLLIGNYDVDLEAELDEGTITGNYYQGSDESTINLTLEDVPLYGMPKLQQSVNAPVRGLFGLTVDLTMPENKFENGYGAIKLTCSECSVGDGETKMFVPGSRGMMAQGVTVPEIYLGSIVGIMNVEKGKAVMEEFEAQSDDITLRMGGEVLLKDPFPKTRLELIIKLFVSDRLKQENDQINLMIGSSAKSAQMDPPDEGWLGFKLRGSVGRPRFSGIKSKTKEERLQEARQKRRDRKKARAKKKKQREAEKEAEKEEEADKQQEAIEEGAFIQDPNKEEDDEDKPAAGEASSVVFDPGAASGEEEGGAGDDEGDDESGAGAAEEEEAGGEEQGGDEEAGGAEAGEEDGEQPQPVLIQ